MTDYVYGPTTFGSRDSLAPGNTNKVISGADFDFEFNKLVASSASKLNSLNPVFTGTMNAGTSGDGSIINGGTF
jgi:hypothetical protein